MVGRWGMSDTVGPIAVTDGRQDGVLLPGAMPASEPTQELVNKEVRRIVDEAEDEVIGLLKQERDRLERLATALLKREHSTSPRPTPSPACHCPMGSPPSGTRPRRRLSGEVEYCYQRSRKPQCR